ncbi:MAG: B12-binding domain-containing radical SAM protein [Promethearchaeota archaeon]|jgi:radical SAM superfamily enzyme YgiQ (UPF0313 family)
MIKVQMVQINDNFGNQYYLPYSVGVLTQYALQSELVRDHCKFNDPIYSRVPVDDIVKQIGTVDVLGISSYIWNWNISRIVGERVKKANPECFIIYGGPQIPDNDEHFLEKNSFMDMTVYGEGEQAFLKILEALVQKNIDLPKESRENSMSSIPSTRYYNRYENRTYHNQKKPRMTDISQLPSPYLGNYFDNLIRKNPSAQWMAIWETNRGCPFQCTFCDWGSASASRVTDVDWDRLVNELKWFVENKIEFVLGADANFGIRRRDIDLAKEIVKSKKEHGYPKSFKTCFTKNSTDKIFEIAKIFHDAEMQRGISLSMQSLYEPTLKAVKRDNIKLSTFEQLQKKYLEAQIPTFTELILALPEETYETFTDGIEKLLRAGQHSQILIYNCSIMANAEMGDPEYQKKYGLKTVNSPTFIAHASQSLNEIVEKEPIVVQTNTMSVEDWKKCSQFSAVIQCFHSFGILQMIALFLYGYHRVPYKQFYESFIKFSMNNSLLNDALAKLDNFLNSVLKEEGRHEYIKDFGDISWTPEEIMFLTLSNNRQALEMAIRNFMKEYDHYFHDSLLEELLLLQFSVVAHWSDTENLNINLNYDIPEQIRRIKMNQNTNELRSGNYVYQIEKRGYRDKEDFARYAVWYGRKQTKTIGNISRIV